MIRLPRPSRVRRSTRGATVLAVVLAAGLSACGGGSSGSGGQADPSGPSESSTSSASAGSELATPDPTAYAEVPDGVELTPAGTSLGLGDTATVAWSPRQDLVAVVDLKIRSVELTSTKQSFGGYQLDDDARRSTPYFVRAQAVNVGDTDLGGRALPLYTQDELGEVVEATGVDEAFEPCRDAGLPEEFAPGERAEVCLLFFLGGTGELSSVSFFPAGDLPAIDWSGDVTRYDPRPDPRPDRPKVQPDEQPRQQPTDGATP